MLISLHLPKTAGSSFLNSLADHYGDRLIRDYTDLPLHSSPFKRNMYAISESIMNRYKDYEDKECVHGHFLPLKYRFQKKNNHNQFVTWMREPSERIASQYFYMKRNYNPIKTQAQSLLKKMIDEDWSLERFCLGPELKNTYSQFLWGFPLQKFDFIGILEDYENDLNYFSENILENNLKQYNKNANPSIQGKSYYENNNFKKQVQKHHSIDMDLYNKALDLKVKR